jgi:hypothetical protein
LGVVVVIAFPSVVSSATLGANPAEEMAKAALYEDKGQMVFLLYIAAKTDPRKLEAEVRAKLRKSDVSKIDIDVV